MIDGYTDRRSRKKENESRILYVGRLSQTYIKNQNTKSPRGTCNLSSGLSAIKISIVE